MNREDFFECVRKRIAEIMGDEYEVTLNNVVKNNGLELTGIIIMEKSKSAAPTIYLDDYYDEIKGNKETKEIGRIVNEVLRLYKQNCNNLDFDFSFFSDYGKMESRIMYKLLNYEANRKLLLDVPHVRYMDLAVVFYVLVDHESIGNGSVLIHNNHAQMWKVSESDLYETATKNTPKLMQYRFSSMDNIIAEFLDSEEAVDFLTCDEIRPNDLYVLTNNKKLFGAACLLYDGLLKRISQKLKSSLYIIPSSIHELIIIPQKAFPYTKDELIEMVRTVNANEVDIVDILSDNVYEYKLGTEDICF